MIEINDNNFEEILNKNSMVVVDFGASWCGPCKSLAPVFEEIAAKYSNDGVVFAKCNIDSNDIFPTKSNIRNIPSLLFFKNGVEKNRLVGSVQSSAIGHAVIKLKND